MNNDEHPFAYECPICGKEHGNETLRDICKLSHELEKLYEEFPRAKSINSALKIITDE